jgi:hypothetical protein
MGPNDELTTNSINHDKSFFIKLAKQFASIQVKVIKSGDDLEVSAFERESDDNLPICERVVDEGPLDKKMMLDLYVQRCVKDLLWTFKFHHMRRRIGTNIEITNKLVGTIAIQFVIDKTLKGNLVYKPEENVKDEIEIVHLDSRVLPYKCCPIQVLWIYQNEGNLKLYKSFLHLLFKSLLRKVYSLNENGKLEEVSEAYKCAFISYMLEGASLRGHSRHPIANFSQLTLDSQILQITYLQLTTQVKGNVSSSNYD